MWHVEMGEGDGVVCGDGEGDGVACGDGEGDGVACGDGEGDGVACGDGEGDGVACGYGEGDGVACGDGGVREAVQWIVWEGIVRVIVVCLVRMSVVSVLMGSTVTQI